MLFRNKAFVVIVILPAISLLVLLDFYNLRLQSRHGYHSDVLEVREYDGDQGAFRVLFSKLRDAKEANELLAARSNYVSDVSGPHHGELPQGSVEEGQEDVGKTVRVDKKEAETTEVAPMRFKPRTQSPSYGNQHEFEYEREEQESSQMITPRIHPEDSSSSKGNIVKRQSVLEPNVQAIHKPGLNYSSNYPISNSQRQKTTVNAVKKLLLYNEIESAEALWAVAQNQRPSENKKPSQLSELPQPMKHVRTNDQFHVLSSMSWPVPQFTRTDVLQSQWVKDLKQYLQGITEFRQISVVTVNQEHQEVVLNWLISAVTVAKLSPRNILVLSLSAKLHDFLVSKNMNSVYVSPISVINSAGLKRITSAFNQIHIVRLTFFRLMNHWDYDVVMYDSDAVVLKNPQPLFDANAGVELVGSAGKGPESIGRTWGRTICTGVLLMRSSPDLEIWWEKMSRVARLPFTDQGLVNAALKALHVHWDQVSPLHVDRDMRGTCQNTQLDAVVLSEEKICRYSCDSHKRDQYYVWHKPAIKRNRTVENKKKKARDGGAWFLREDWAQVSKMTSVTGVTWLLSISHNT